MSKAIETLRAALQRGMEGRPKVGGFPYLAETLRKAGVTRNVWSLPAGQSLFLTENGPVVIPGTPLVSEILDVPAFDRVALIVALRPIKPERVRFQSSWPLPGVQASFGTMSISKHEPFPIMVAMARNTSKSILPLRSEDRHLPTFSGMTIPSIVC